MVNVVYACNDMYVRQTIISMVSVMQHNPGAKIYLVEDGISDQNTELINHIMEKNYKTKITFIPIDELLPSMACNEEDRHPRTIYAKLFFENCITESRVLYLDSDVIVTKNLEPLFSRDMSKEVAAGVLMPYGKKLKERLLLQAGEPYICDGVVLFNMDLWKRENISLKCYEHIKCFSGSPPMLSEGTLNYTARRKIGALEPKYNLMPSMIINNLREIRHLFKADCYYENKEEFDEARQEPAIIHFMSELFSRPWQQDCEHPFRQLYLDIEKQIFGKNQMENTMLASHTRKTMWLRKHLPFEIFSAIYHIKNRI